MKHSVIDTLNDFIDEAARTHGGHPAFVAPDGGEISYSDLRDIVIVIHDALIRCGIGAGDRVAIYVPNGTSQALALLGVASSAVAVPINAAATGNEIFSHIERTRAQLLVLAHGCDAAVRAQARQRGIPVLIIAGDGPRDDAQSMIVETPENAVDSLRRWIAPTAADTAILLSTSGTTARPKLVPLNHERMLRIAQTYAEIFELDEHDRCLELMPFVHTHGIFSLLSSLWAKSSVACMPSFRSDLFFRWLDAVRPTWYTAVPTIHQAILADAPKYSEQIERSKLRFVRSSASHLSQSVIAAIESTWNAGVIETYGLTEASLTTVSLPRARKAGSVGRGASAGVEMKIVQGEVWLHGPLLIDAYADDAEVSKAAFNDNWFRTGDQGRIDDEGYLFITGRIKELINRGGENIAPQEIDDALLAHPDIIEAASFALPHERLGEEVAAAIVLREGASHSDAGLRGFLAQALAPYKIPTRTCVVESIPKGPTGKYQRNRLPDLLAKELTIPTVTGFIEPTVLTSVTEKKLYAIWSTLFPQTASRGDLDFFALGGDSLQAAQLMAEIEATFGVHLGIATLLEHATIAALAKLIDLAQTDAPTGVLNIVRRDGTKTPVFFFHQDFRYDGLYCAKFAQQLDPQRPFYALAPTFVSQQRGFQSIEAMADEYLAVIRSVKPQGPYILGGFCAGGTVAFEIARRLRAIGETIELVVLINSVAKNARWVPARKLVAVALRALRKPPSEEDRYFLRLRSVIKKLGRVADKLRPRKSTPATTHAPPRADDHDYSNGAWLIYSDATRAYVPEPYTEPVAICLAVADAQNCDTDDVFGWHRFATRRSARHYTGAQNDLITTHLPAIASFVEQCLITQQANA